MTAEDTPSAPRKRGRPRGSADPDAGAIRALDRGLDVLGVLAEAGGLTLTGMAARLGQPTSTLHRVLTTLERRGMAELDPATQTWHVGPEAFRVGSAFMRRSGLVERARPILRALMERTGETANLGVARGNLVLFLAQVETHEMIRAFFPPGTLSPMHASGIGKALLAHRTPAELREIAAEGLERFTPRTRASLADLSESLSEVRARGFALDDEERTPGMRCIAAPVFDLTGAAVAGLSVSGPVNRMSDRRLAEVAAAVTEAAQDLSRALGAPPPA
ncbi:MAG TPA: IclR family transcriptional regulator [Paracoccus sp. (in: a-proteobacteria)]|nr:IclR family transcriptional regulator [Paracoccus sp. (in: a-proteobacteria)]